uniref:Uncharacterized protein n=1 Tax=Arundo donax TaxID=35708 RepID=A0A0A9H4I3_ARUDO
MLPVTWSHSAELE